MGGHFVAVLGLELRVVARVVVVVVVRDLWVVVVVVRDRWVVVVHR